METYFGGGESCPKIVEKIWPVEGGGARVFQEDEVQLVSVGGGRLFPEPCRNVQGIAGEGVPEMG